MKWKDMKETREFKLWKKKYMKKTDKELNNLTFSIFHPLKYLQDRAYILGQRMVLNELLLKIIDIEMEELEGKDD